MKAAGFWGCLGAWGGSPSLVPHAASRHGVGRVEGAQLLRRRVSQPGGPARGHELCNHHRLGVIVEQHLRTEAMGGGQGEQGTRRPQVSSGQRDSGQQVWRTVWAKERAATGVVRQVSADSGHAPQALHGSRGAGTTGMSTFCGRGGRRAGPSP